MPRHDFAWRLGGAAFFAGAGAIGLTTGGHGVLCFTLAIAGIVLAIQGRRVPLALRIERSRHRTLAAAIHAAHLTHRADAARALRSRTDPEGGVIR